MNNPEKLIIPGGHGANAPRSKFTTEQVRIIREQRAAGVSAMEIATMYGVNVTTIHRIISERTYVKEAKRQREIETRIKEDTPEHEKTPVSQAGVK